MKLKITASFSGQGIRQYHPTHLTKSKGAGKLLPMHYPQVRIKQNLDESVKIC